MRSYVHEYMVQNLHASMDASAVGIREFRGCTLICVRLTVRLDERYDKDERARGVPATRSHQQ